MSLIHRRGPAQINANLTPMIDVTFLLIVFFVLVSQIVEVENVDLALPLLLEPETEMQGEEQRAVVNVVPNLGREAREYRLGSRTFPVGRAGLDGLTAHLAVMLEANPSMRVNLRADRRTDYEWVHPVLEAVAAAASNAGAAPRVNLVVLRED